MPFQKKTVTKALCFLLTGFLCFAMFATPHVAHAQGEDDRSSLEKAADFLSSMADGGASFFTKQIPAALSWLILFVVQLFGSLASFFGTYVVKLGMANEFVGSKIVQVGWPVVRDIANIFFIVVLIVIAFGTIVGSEEYGWRHRLPALIFAIVIVNFSKIILGFIIDIVQVITLTFFSALSSDGGGGFVDAFKLGDLQNFAGASAVDNSGGAGFEGTQIFAASIMAFLIAGSIAYLLGTMTVRLLMRYIMLCFCIVLAPAALLARAFPPLEHFYEEWHHLFIEHLTYGPGIAFSLWLVVAVISQSDFSWSNILNGDLSGLLGYGGTEIAHAMTNSTSFDYLINFAGNFILFTSAMQFADKFAAGSAGAAKGLGAKMAGMARGAGARVLGGTARLGGRAAMGGVGLATSGARIAGKGATGGVTALAGGAFGAVGGALAARKTGQGAGASALEGMKSGASRGFSFGAQAPGAIVSAPGKVVKKVKDFADSARLRASTVGQGETGQVVRQAAVAKEEREELNKQESKYGGMSAAQVAQGMSSTPKKQGEKSQLERAALGELGRDKNLQRAAGVEYMKSDEAVQRFRDVDVSDTKSQNEFNAFVQQSSGGSEVIAKDMRDAMLQRQSLMGRRGAASTASAPAPAASAPPVQQPASPAPARQPAQPAPQPRVQRPSPAAPVPPPPGSPFGDMDAATEGAPELDQNQPFQQPPSSAAEPQEAPQPPASPAPAAGAAPATQPTSAPATNSSAPSSPPPAAAPASNQPQNQPPQGGAPTAQIDAAQLQAAFKQAGGQLSEQLRNAIKSGIGIDPLKAPEFVKMLQGANNEQIAKLRSLGAKNKQRVERGEMPAHVAKILNQGGQSRQGGGAPSSRRAA